MFRVHRWVRFVGLLLLGWLAAACQATGTVSVDVADDGSGTVDVEIVLDEEAAAGVLDLSDAGLALNDLAQSGWEIRPPEVGDDGSTRLGATKPFGTPEQFAEIADELAGPDGLFGDLELSRVKTFGQVDYRLDGSLRPDGFDGFVDDELTAALGRSIDDIAADYGARTMDVEIELVATLPGDALEGAEETGTLVSEDPASRRWELTLDRTEPVPVGFGTAARNMTPLVLRGVAVLLAVIAGVLLLGQLLSLLTPERPTPRRRQRTNRPREGATVEAAALTEPVAGDDGRPPGPRVVALDGMGVLYRVGQDTTELLVPFLRELGVSASSEEILDRSRRLSLGRITSAEFWDGFGLTADPNSLDDAYLSRHQLTPGVVRFLRELRDNGIGIAVVTNDCSAWAMKLRSRHSLDALIDTWVISGSVGVRKPDRPIFEVLRRIAGVPAEEILVVDDELTILDAARDLGFQTAWFRPGADGAVDSNGHEILRSFETAGASA